MQGRRFRLVLYQGEMPGAVSSVARLLQAIPLDEQRLQAAVLHEFLRDQRENVFQINADNIPRVGIINVAATSKVKAIHVFNVGTSPLG